MYRIMAEDPEIIREVMPERVLMEQIAAAVRKVGWIYAFFWALSTKQPRVLAWSAGYYNGQIKTRKTTRAAELDADQMGFQRSKQLRELYESLVSGDGNQQIRRPCTSISPEDLTDTEWYYLICMSFTFTLGRGLPGKTFEDNQYNWLSNATMADPVVFPRSLLAKGAGIQTIVCIPIMGGALELGTTEQVIDDSALVMSITSFFSERHNPVCTSTPMMIGDEAHILCAGNDAEISTVLELQHFISDCKAFLDSTTGPTNIEDELYKEEMNEELHADTLKESPNKCCPTQQPDDLFEIDVQTAQNEDQLMGDDSNSFFNTILENLQEGIHSKLISLDLHGEDSHYANTVSIILQNSYPGSQALCSLKASLSSSFLGWRTDFDTQELVTSTPQKLLKQILVHRAWLQGVHQVKEHQEEGLQESTLHLAEESGGSHMLSERRRREKINEKFLVLRSLLPSINKIDKASVLGDTIEYLKELQKRVQQLERNIQSVDPNNKHCKMNLPGMVERRSDNCSSKEMMNRDRRNPQENKRKTRDEIDVEHHWVLSQKGAIAINITLKEKEVQLEVHCPWREYLLLQLIESMGELHLDPLMVQSSTADGVMSLTIKFKVRSSAAASPRMIKGSIERVIRRDVFDGKIQKF